MAIVRMTSEEIHATGGKIDRTKVDATTEQDIRRQMIEDGKDPDAPIVGARVMIPPAVVRKKAGLSQDAFAKAIGVPLATLRNWEQGRTEPDPAVRALFALIYDDPQRAFRVLSKESAA